MHRLMVTSEALGRTDTHTGRERGRSLQEHAVARTNNRREAHVWREQIDARALRHAKSGGAYATVSVGTVSDPRSVKRLCIRHTHAWAAPTVTERRLRYIYTMPTALGGPPCGLTVVEWYSIRRTRKPVKPPVPVEVTLQRAPHRHPPKTRPLLSPGLSTRFGWLETACQYCGSRVRPSFSWTDPVEP